MIKFKNSLFLFIAISFTLSSCFACRDVVEDNPVPVIEEEDCFKPTAETMYIYQNRAWCNIENPSVRQLDSLESVGYGYGWQEPDTSHLTLAECLHLLKIQWPEWKKNGPDYNYQNYNKRVKCVSCGSQKMVPEEWLNN